MVQVKILVEGYAREYNGYEKASSTAVLICSRGLNIIVDPGMDRKALLKGLIRQGLKPKDIDFVILTHTHPDHCLLTGIFENARVLDNDLTYSWNGIISKHKGKIPGTEIKIISTSGHDLFHCSVLVKTKELGRVVIAGDVFWWRDNEKQKIDKGSLLKHKDPFMKSWQKLQTSRKKVLRIADYIIPGHGKMFKAKGR